MKKAPEGAVSRETKTTKTESTNMETKTTIPELPLGQLEEVLEIEEYDGRECEHGRGLTEFCRPCFDRQRADDRYLR